VWRRTYAHTIDMRIVQQKKGRKEKKKKKGDNASKTLLP
jgi:hypothetical protein